MNELVMPANVASQLQGLPNPVKLCNPAGKAIGCFVPTIDASLYEIEGPEPTDVQLREAEAATEWYSTADVLRHLEKLQ